MLKDQLQSKTSSPVTWVLVSIIAPFSLFTGYLVLANYVHSTATGARFLIGMVLCAAVGCWPIMRTTFSVTTRLVLSSAYIALMTMIFFAYGLATACQVFHDCFP